MPSRKGFVPILYLVIAGALFTGLVPLAKLFRDDKSHIDWRQYDPEMVAKALKADQVFIVFAAPRWHANTSYMEQIFNSADVCALIDCNSIEMFKAEYNEDALETEEIQNLVQSAGVSSFLPFAIISSQSGSDESPVVITGVDQSMPAVLKQAIIDATTD